MADIDDLVERHEADPSARLGQRTLARELTATVHGDAAAAAAVEASEVLFGRDVDPRSVSSSALEFVSGEVPSSTQPLDATSVVDLLVATELAQSRGDAKRAVAEGGVYINGVRVADAEQVLGPGDLIHDRFLLLRRGKKRWHVAVTG